MASIAKLFGFDTQVSFKTFKTEHPSVYAELFSKDIAAEIENLEDQTTELELRIRRHARTVLAKKNLPSISVYCQGLKTARGEAAKKKQEARSDRRTTFYLAHQDEATLTPPSTPSLAPNPTTSFVSLNSPKRRLIEEDSDIDESLDIALPPAKRRRPEMPLVSEVDSLRAQITHLEAEAAVKDATIAKLTGQLKSGICRFCSGRCLG